MDHVLNALLIVGGLLHGLCYERTPFVLPAELAPPVEVAGMPFCLTAMAEALNRVAPIHSGRPRSELALRAYLSEIRLESYFRDIPPEIPLAIGMQETRWQYWQTSPSAEFCGPFQQAPRFVLDPPMPSIGARSRCLSLGYTAEECRTYTRPCRHVDRCREYCTQLTDPMHYRTAVGHVFDYLELIRRRTGDVWKVCRYQGGPYRPCDEHARGYQARHEAWRERIITSYRRVLADAPLWCD